MKSMHSDHMPFAWMKTISAIPLSLACVAGAFAWSPVASADEPEEPATPPAAVSEDPKAEEEDDAPPSLDDLLGIETDEEEDAVSADSEQAARDLERDLAGESPGNLLVEALAGMKNAADRLAVRRDTGLATQRTQEDVLAKLDQLIDAAKRQQQQQQQQSSSSSSSQSQSNSQQSRQPDSDPGKQQRGDDPEGQNPGEGDQSEQTSSTSDSNGAQPGTPGFQDGARNNQFQETREEWGALPERFREMLLQGRSDRFSSLYERMTREYYRRLAEEGSTP